MTDRQPDILRVIKKQYRFVSSKLLLRARFLFILPMPLFFMGLYSLSEGSIVPALARLGGLVLFLLAAWMVLEGEKAAYEYEEREIAKPPRFPRKGAAAVLTAIAVALTAMFGFSPVLDNPVSSVLFALLAGVLHVLSFGRDPNRAKGLEGYSEVESERLLEALEKGETLALETLDAARRFSDRSLQHRVESLIREARRVFREIEKDPRDLRRSRKFMAVYLQGARDATVKMARVNRTSHAKSDFMEYESLLRDLEQQFIRQREALLQNDRTELDIEVEVLRDRIKQENRS